MKLAVAGVPSVLGRQRDDYRRRGLLPGQRLRRRRAARTMGHAREPRLRATQTACSTIFDERGVKATFFVLGWVARRFPSSSGALPARATRSRRTATRIDSSTTRRRLPSARTCSARKALLEEASGQQVNGYRAPSYSVTPKTALGARCPDRRRLHVRRQHLSDSSRSIRHPVAPRHPYVASGRTGTILEAPGSTVRFGLVNFPVGGRRVFPAPAVCVDAMGIARINRTEGRPAIFYLHPWEIDPDQPKFNPGLISRFRHYRNLSKTEGRLRALLSDFQFAPLNSVLRLSAASAEVPSAAPLPFLR